MTVGRDRRYGRDDMQRLLDHLDALQRRIPVIGLPFAVLKRFSEHNGGRLATTIAYWSFFSLFPLLLVFVTILNLVVRNDPELRRELVDGALGQVPVLGSQLAETQTAISGSWIGIAVGVLTALWTGLAAARALQAAFDVIWDVPGHRRPNAAIGRVKALAFLVVLAISLSLSTVATNLASIVGLGGVVTVAGVVIAVVVNTAILTFAMWFLTTSRPHPRALWIGALVAAVGLVILQFIGTWLVERHIQGANDVYGTFAIVIALLSWFFLVSRLILLGMELNSVLAENLSPRSLVKSTTPTPADERAAELDVQRITHDPRLSGE